jgi:MobA-like NTP transferase domain
MARRGLPCPREHLRAHVNRPAAILGELPCHRHARGDATVRAVTDERPVAGIFVGGGGERMGGRAKGLLESPDGGTLVKRWHAVLREAGVARVLLVGRHPA